MTDQYSLSPPGYLLSPPSQSDYASWGKRVRARVIDLLPTYLGLIIFGIGYLIFIVRLALSDGSTLHVEGAAVAMIIGSSVMLASLGWIAYNRWHLAGRTGQSLGKRVSKIMLIGGETKAPIGPKNTYTFPALARPFDGPSPPGAPITRSLAPRQSCLSGLRMAS